MPIVKSYSEQVKELFPDCEVCSSVLDGIGLRYYFRPKRDSWLPDFSGSWTGYYQLIDRQWYVKASETDVINKLLVERPNDNIVLEQYINV